MSLEMPERTKDPAETLDYGWDWNAPPGDPRTGGPWLSTGDTITASTWTITGPDNALTKASPAFTTTTTTVWLSGGTLGQDYILTNDATTAQGRHPRRSMTIRIRNR